MPGWFMLAATVLLGLVLGSFATALAWRLPRGVSMISKARSACPACKADLGIPDLVPLFSWLALKGRCRRCKAQIPARYPLIELGTLALCLGFYFVHGFTWQTPFLFMLAPVLAAIIAIDLEHKIIPDALNAAVFLLGLGFLAAGKPDMQHVTGALAGAALYGGGSFLLRFVFTLVLKREPLGLGDVKFFAAAGTWLGAAPLAAAFFMTLSGGFGVVLALAWKKLTGEEAFPFGPALVLAFVALMLWRTPLAM